ncbi:hypothetical protein BC829DRAFT_417136 [Chytridium lagenaria]|nr:hypothetical protein BC829DRAFT_417136 [Chytridium lagenaria]
MYNDGLRLKILYLDCQLVVMLPSVSLADSNPSQYPITPTQKLNLDSDLSSLLKGGTVISSLASTTSLHKSQYLENGGNDAKILNQLALLEEEAKLLEERNVERPATKDVDAGTCQMNYGTYPMYTTESEDESRLKRDFISGIPNTPTSSIEITYGIIDRENPVFFLSTFKSRGKFRSTLFSNVYVLAHSSQEKNAQPKRSMQMVIQIRLLRRKDTVDLYDLRPFAWTSVDLFSADKLLNAGKCQLIGDVRLTRHPEIIDDYESFSSEFESIQPLSPVSPKQLKPLRLGKMTKVYVWGDRNRRLPNSESWRSNVVNPMTGEENRVEAQLLIEEFQNYIPLPSFFIKIRIVTSNGMDLQPLWMSDALAGLDAKGLVKWKTLNVITELMTSDFSIGFRLVVEICQVPLQIPDPETYNVRLAMRKGVYTLSLICNDISAASISFRIKAVDLAAQPSEEVPAAETLVDPWLESKYERTKNVKATRGDVMTLYIDGARFLPQNCTISRAISKVFSRDLKEAEGCEPVETCPTLDSPIFSPTFQMPLIKPLHHRQAYVPIALIGVSLLNLYKDATSNEQPSEKALTNAVVNEDLSTAVKFDHTCAVAVDQAWNLKLKAFTVPVVKICEVRDGTKGLEMGVLGVKVAGKFGALNGETGSCLTYSNKAYELKSQGWTLLPVNTSPGIPDSRIISNPTPLLSLLQKKSFNDAVFAATKNKALRINKKGGSVLIRVCDQRLTGDLKAGVDIDTSNLPNGDFLNYLESPPLRKLIPKGVTEENFRERCVATITQLTKEKE